MTREEAIGTMNYLKYYAETDTTERNVLEERDRVRFIEAVEMAIQALSQEPCRKDCRLCKEFDECENGKKGHKNGTSIGYSIGECKDYKPCTDAVSREAVEEIINDIRDCIGVEGYCAILERLKKLPPVTPSNERVAFLEHELKVNVKKWKDAYEEGKKDGRPKGCWVGIDEKPHEDYECNRCGYVCSTFTANIKPSNEYKYCPNCGAKMVGPQERSE